MQNLFCKLNILSDLFSENDFDFLSNISSTEKNIQSKIDKTSPLRESLVSYISELKLSDALTSKEHSDLLKAQRALKKLNAVISNLYDLQNEIQEIEKSILNVIFKKEEHEISDDELNEAVNKIKDDIRKYDTFFKTSDSVNNSSIDLVKKFLKSSNVPNRKSSNVSSIIDNSISNNNSIADSNISSNNSIADSNISSNNCIADSNISDNLTLRISEKDNKVFLPYSKDEIIAYVEAYPNVYKDAQSVIDRDFIVNLNFYSKHPVLARFRETYALLHDREMKSFADSLKGAIDLMFKGEINPAIIAGLKSETQLNEFLGCLQNNDLDNFKPFKIIFEFNPSKIYLENN